MKQLWDLQKAAAAGGEAGWFLFFFLLLLLLLFLKQQSSLKIISSTLFLLSFLVFSYVLTNVSIYIYVFLSNVVSNFAMSSSKGHCYSDEALLNRQDLPCLPWFFKGLDLSSCVSQSVSVSRMKFNVSGLGENLGSRGLWTKESSTAFKPWIFLESPNASR